VEKLPHRVGITASDRRSHVYAESHLETPKPHRYFSSPYGDAHVDTVAPSLFPFLAHEWVDSIYTTLHVPIQFGKLESYNPKP
jgi:hypothetical protein